MRSNCALAFAMMAVSGLAGGIHGQTRDSTPSAVFEVTEATIDEVQSALRDGRVTCQKLVDAYLARIQAYDKAGPALNAVQTINTRAREQADRLDAVFKASGPVGRLHCVPTLVKDQIDTMELPTTHGFVGFKDFLPQSDATVVARLKAAGALIIGKATMGEFASGSPGRHRIYGAAIWGVGPFPDCVCLRTGNTPPPHSTAHAGPHGSMTPNGPSAPEVP
jgi:hypothetical protein